MEQRRLRLGDIIDDYCPRERRLSNHVIVAMIDDDVKQTRCTTCDADHPYKHARIPPKRKRTDAPAALARPVPDGALDDVQQNGDAAPVVGAVLRPAAPPPRETRAEPPAEPAAQTFAAAPAPDASASPVDDPDLAAPQAPPDDDGPVHRPLIRATLPRIEGQVPERKAPDFTLRLPGARLGPLRHAEVNGNRLPGGPGGGKPPRHAKGGRPGPKGARPLAHGSRASGFAHGSHGQRPSGPQGHRARGRGPQGGGKKRSR